MLVIQFDLKLGATVENEAGAVECGCGSACLRIVRHSPSFTRYSDEVPIKLFILVFIVEYDGAILAGREIFEVKRGSSHLGRHCLRPESGLEVFGPALGGFENQHSDDTACVSHALGNNRQARQFSLLTPRYSGRA